MLFRSRLPEVAGSGARWVCSDCHAEWEVIWESDYVHDGRPDTLGWFQVVGPVEQDVKAKADEVTQLMHELAHQEIDPAVIHALIGVASHTTQGIINRVHAAYGAEAAQVLMDSWNLFVRTVHPYFMGEPCKHHAWDDREK